MLIYCKAWNWALALEERMHEEGKAFSRPPQMPEQHTAIPLKALPSVRMCLFSAQSEQWEGGSAFKSARLLRSAKNHKKTWMFFSPYLSTHDILCWLKHTAFEFIWAGWPTSSALQMLGRLWPLLSALAWNHFTSIREGDWASGLVPSIIQTSSHQQIIFL